MISAVHLLPDSELPLKFFSENPATDEIVHFKQICVIWVMHVYGIFVLQALHVLTPVKESRSDLDLKNLPQTGIG